ncbi:hypothetical protein KI387_041757 [Taxus chinensis]|uniref:Pectate lyase n=1 Tax=Taxus chinensis TaxID=29808 RepID=A0AA38C933_TAXCH|nr:hypothetical protein KI387_041757 [Taxus chinensis]
MTSCIILSMAVVVSAAKDSATHVPPDFQSDYSYSKPGFITTIESEASKDVGKAFLFHGEASKDVGNTSITFEGSLRRRKIAGRRGKGRGRGRRCRVADGTKCQFSRCGRGKLLPRCATGFASGVVGGRRGLSYTVTSHNDSLSNPAPGTLRYGAGLAYSNPRGVWITFSRDMTIRLRTQLLVWNHTTIDGRGFKIIITQSNIGMSGVENVIIHNLQVSGIYGGTGDTVHIFNSRKVWVDHLTCFDGENGLVSAVEGSTDITISNCYLANNNFNMLLGAEDTDIVDKDMRVTIYRNWFKNSNQRMPHCRWGYCHVVNNLYANWGLYAISARENARILSERNVFVAGIKPEVTQWSSDYNSQSDITPRIVSKGDLLLNGARFHEFLHFGRAGAPPYRRPRNYPPVVKPGKLFRLIGRCSGALVGKRIRSCFLYG